MPIPSHHNEGDTGHTDDHNSIVDTLTSQAASITSVQSSVSSLSASLPGTYVAKAGNNTVGGNNTFGNTNTFGSGNTFGGNNTINVTNPSGYARSIVIPSGSRDNNAYVDKITYGGRQTFGLDSYGQARLGSAADNLTPLEVYGPSGQTGNLLNLRKGGLGGSLVAYFDANGNLAAPNVDPTAWTTLSLASGLSTNFGAPPQYRSIGDMVYLRGNIKKTDNSNFTVSPVDLGTLPSDFWPPQTTYFVQPAAFVSDEAYMRVEVMPGSGLIRAYFRAGTYNPAWVSLDGMYFSRTG